jgi:hypothetical protein
MKIFFIHSLLFFCAYLDELKLRVTQRKGDANTPERPSLKLSLSSGSRSPKGGKKHARIWAATFRIHHGDRHILALVN